MTRLTGLTIHVHQRIGDTKIRSQTGNSGEAVDYAPKFRVSPASFESHGNSDFIDDATEITLNLFPEDLESFKMAIFLQTRENGAFEGGKFWLSNFIEQLVFMVR